MLYYDVPAHDGGAQRTIEAQCEFTLMPAVDSSNIQVVVTGSAVAHSNPGDGAAAATGIKCELRSPRGDTTVERAFPGSLVTVDGLIPLRLTPLTLCASVSVLWSDGVFQTAEEPICAAPS